MKATLKQLVLWLLAALTALGITSCGSGPETEPGPVLTVRGSWVDRSTQLEFCGGYGQVDIELNLNQADQSSKLSGDMVLG